MSHEPRRTLCQVTHREGPHLRIFNAAQSSAGGEVRFFWRSPSQTPLRPRAETAEAAAGAGRLFVPLGGAEGRAASMLSRPGATRRWSASSLPQSRAVQRPASSWQAWSRCKEKNY